MYCLLQSTLACVCRHTAPGFNMQTSWRKSQILSSTSLYQIKIVCLLFGHTLVKTTSNKKKKKRKEEHRKLHKVTAAICYNT